MILPTKHIRLDRSLLGLGADLLRLLNEERTVSSLWDAVTKRRQQVGAPNVSFDWFVLAIDFLYAAGAVELLDGRVRRTMP